MPPILDPHTIPPIKVSVDQLSFQNIDGDGTLLGQIDVTTPGGEVSLHVTAHPVAYKRWGTELRMATFAGEDALERWQKANGITRPALLEYNSRIYFLEIEPFAE